MKTIKILWLLALALSANAIQAQERRVERTLVPPDFVDTLITYTSTVPEICVNDLFMNNLKTILFNPKYQVRFNSELERNLRLDFIQEDNLNYSIQVVLDSDEGHDSKGFIEENKFFYWFRGEIPPGIILSQTGTEKQFSSTELRRYKGDDRGGVRVSNPYDPTMWFLVYNQETGQVTDDTY